MPTIMSNDRQSLILYDDNSLKRVAFDFVPRTRQYVKVETEIPNNASEFYAEIGQFINQKTKEVVTELAPHQIEIWNDRWLSQKRAYPKSQKIAVSTLLLMEDMHIAMTDARGQEVIIVAQSIPKAQQHLDDLEDMFRGSKRYRSYMIEKRMFDERDDIKRRDQSAIGRLVVRNPDNPIMPTYIYACTITRPSSLISFKRVKHIHASDITLAEMSEELMKKAWGGLTSRLANTEGTIVFEGPLRGPHGPLYDILLPLYQKQEVAEELPERVALYTDSGYLVRRYTYRVGIESGMMTEKWINQARLELGPLFAMFYEAVAYSSDKMWFDKKHIQKTSDIATDLINS